jgi:hypothetical protein
MSFNKKKGRKQKIREIYLNNLTQNIKQFNGYEKDGYDRDTETSDSSSVASDDCRLDFGTALRQSTSNTCNCYCMFFGIAVIAALITIFIFVL